MNKLGMRATMTLSLAALALAAAPVHAERYVVEPIVDAAVAGDEQGFSQGQLDQMLAPIALYPDSLLSQVLIAATYPLEVVEAARWSRQNSHLEGEEAVAAVANRGWDPSVTALVAFPELLARMDEDLEWTRNLGDAMLFQEEQVMDSIQFLRARADAAGNLDSNDYTRVIREEKTIIIQPAQTRVVHVPYYDPWIVYGSWWRPAYPPVVWAPPLYYHYGHPFYWGSGIHVSSGFFFSSFYWPHRSVVFVHTPRYYHPPRHHRYSRSHYVPGQRWKHNPAHRRGVGYRHAQVRQRFEQPSLRAGPATRWPAEQHASRSDRGSRDWRGREGTGQDRQRTHGGERGGEGRTRDWTGERSGTDSRGRHTSAPTSVSGAITSNRELDGRSVRTATAARESSLSAGARTARPTVSGAEQRLRNSRTAAQSNSRAAPLTSAPQRITPYRGDSSAQPAVRAATRSGAPTQRSATRTQRSATGTQRSTAGPASAPSRVVPRASADQQESQGTTRRGTRSSGNNPGRRLD